MAMDEGILTVVRVQNHQFSAEVSDFPPFFQLHWPKKVL